MTRIPTLAALVALALPLHVLSLGAQEAPDSAEAAGSSLDVPTDRWGISFGNSTRFNGLRINFRDDRLRKINGVNLTLWKPQERVGGSVNGVSFGLYGPRADRLQGINLGLLTVNAEGSARGLNAAGVATVSDGTLWGLNLGGLAVVGRRGATGLNVGGLANVTQGPARGINLGGLAMVSQWHASGINVGGLATVTFGRSRWINLGGLAAVGSGGAEGLTVGGLAAISQLWMRGVNLGGLAVVGTDEISGLSVAGAGILSGSGIVRGVQATAGKVHGRRSITGLTLAGYRIETRRLTGAAVGGWVDAEEMYGLSIALFNSADRLRGVQLGLLNRAGNNPPPFRWLPILNLHF